MALLLAEAVDPHKAIFQELSTSLSLIAGMLVLACAAAVLDRFDILSVPLERWASASPVKWLALAALVLAAPEIYENRDHFEIFKAGLQAQALDADALVYMTQGDSCGFVLAGRRMSEAKAIALEELGDRDQADEVRKAIPDLGACPAPSDNP